MIHGTIKPLFNTPINWGHPLSQGLCASYLMNEGCGDLVHDSCGMNDGKMINMAPMSGTSGWVPGPHGPALAFNGSNNCVNLASLALTATNNFTISGRYKPNNPATGATQVAVNNGDGYINGYYLRWRDGRWFFVMRSIDYGAGIAGNVGSWQHIVTVRSNNTNYIYLNGFSNNIGAAAPNPPTGSTQIGQDGRDSAYFNGLISSTSIYNRALSAEEIAYLYAFPWCMYDSGMSAWEYNQQNRNFDHYYRRLMAA